MLNLAGSSSDNIAVAQVTWANDRSGSGTASGTSNWSITDISLFSGLNTLTVTARDTVGNESSTTLAVTYTPPDTTKPSLSIQSPTTSSSYATSVGLLNLAGNASDNIAVAQVSWTNDRGGSGSASGASNWSISGITLFSGLNTLTVTARDTVGNESTTTLAVTYTPPDTTKPSLSINSPTTSSSYATSIGLLNLGGSASDNIAVAQVTWTNDRGGSGSASGTSNWSISGITLSSGLNTLSVTARDTVGNESTTTLAVTYTPPDTTKPSLSIQSPTASSSYATSIGLLNLGGSASDNLAVAQVTWTNDRGGSGSASGTSDWSITGITLFSGLNTLTITARDTVGNQSSAALLVSYSPPDTTNPILQITAPTLSPTFSTTVSVLSLAGSASDNIAVQLINWSNDRGGSGLADGTTSWSTAVNLQPGLNNLIVRATDSAGNAATATLAVTYNSSSAPIIAIFTPTSQGAYTTTSGTLKLTGGASGSPALSRITWDNDRGGGGVASGFASWSANDIVLQPGANRITVTAWDTAGNSTKASIAITYDASDAVSPQLMITSHVSSSNHSTTAAMVKVGGWASDNVGVTQIVWSNSRGGSGVAVGTASWRIDTNLQPGSNELTITARDAAGNITSARLSISYAPEAGINPTVAISSPTPSNSYTTSSGKLDLSGSATSLTKIVQVSWANDRGGSGIASGTSSWSISAISLTSGINNLTLAARDIDGKEGTTSLAVTYAPPDTTGPIVHITTPTTSPTYSATANILSLAGSASDDNAVREVTWSNDRGGSGLADGTVAWSTAVTLKSGLNKITVSATDYAGNIAASTLTVTYNSGTPPVIAIFTPTSQGTYTTTSSTLKLAGGASGSPALSRITWTNDRGGDGIANGTASWSIKEITLQPGSNRISVTAWDTAGNSTEAVIAVTCNGADTESPKLTITSPAPSPSHSTTAAIVKVGGWASDNVGVTQIVWSNSRGGSGVAVGTASWSIDTNLQPGSNELTITARDAAGNITSARLSISYAPEAGINPTVAISSPTPLNSYTTSNGTLDLSGSATSLTEIVQVSWANDRGGSGIASGTTSWSISAISLTIGINNLTLTARDGLGVETTTTLGVVYAPPDVTSPTMEITAPTSSPSHSTTSSILTLGGSASDDFGIQKIAWTNDRGGTGLAEGVSNWSATVTLQPGVNNLAVTATDAAGNTTTANLAVTYSTGTPPIIAIFSPTSLGAYTTTGGIIKLAGGASGSPALSRVTWENDRGGGGIATGTASWSAKDILLQPGSNRITVTAWDTGGNSAKAIITITYNGSAPQTPTQIPVRYAISDGKLLITWTDPGYVLQTRPSLLDSNWTDVSGGSPFSAPTGEEQGFYRLQKRPQP